MRNELHIRYVDWITAQRIWEQVLKVDPHRIDSVDQYSNMLFVMQKKQTLFRLANDYLAADEARPEVSCLIGDFETLSSWSSNVKLETGNYYSSTGEHHKAIKYLRRAVQLDRYHVMAWTLIGHEYIQVKNFQAAIEAYRRAIGRLIYHITKFKADE
jgi:tetratricopeptide (TPR) repeat protein